MIKKLLILSVICSFLIHCDSKQLTPTIQRLDANWTFSSEVDTIWREANVPGNVFTDLMSHNLIPDPFILNNEEKVQWVSEKNWIYKTSFAIDPEELMKNHHQLSFEGLDTYATVFLNDSLILKANNAFRTYKVNVEKLLRESNQLKIEFSNSKVFEEKAKKKLDYELPESNRIFTRKAQFQYGWDWGPKLNTSGIWKDISLKSWNEVVLEDVFVAQGMITETDADIFVELSITSDSRKEVTLSAKTEGSDFQQKLILEKGTYDYTLPISIEKPKLWWPHNMGTPNLYEFKIEVLDGKNVLDERSIKHGIRKVQLFAQPDSIGQSFYFKVNDVPVYMKGANYIPQNSFQNKVSNDHYENLLNDVVVSNMNMLRVWGGGIYENDIFYDLCDEKGILVWQDFMFACAMYPGDEDFLNNVQQEAFDQVIRLRNHASVALWCGNNENSEGWNRWGWQDGKTEEQKQEIWSNYQKVFDSILPYTVDRLTDVNYWESSPKYGRGNPKYKTEGDAHDWWVWHDAYPFEHFEENVPRFMSEFGFQSFPSIEVINHINQSDNLEIDTEAMKAHQKHSRGFQLIDEYMKRDYPEAFNDRDYVYLSQLTQAKGITMGIEAHRRAKPYNMGTLYWQLNDCWPVVSWSSMDHFGNWKALQYKAKSSFKNLLISPSIKDNKVSIHIVNDSLKAINDILFMKIIDFSGNELWSTEKELTIAENSSQIAHEFSLEEMIINLDEVVLVSSFHEEEDFFYFRRPKELKLPNSGLTITAINRTNGGFTISLESSKLEKDIFLSSDANGKFIDNFFDLLPNEKRTIFFETDSDKEPKITFRTLNQVLQLDYLEKQSYKTDSK